MKTKIIIFGIAVLGCLNVSAEGGKKERGIVVEVGGSMTNTCFENRFEDGGIYGDYIEHFEQPKNILHRSGALSGRVAWRYNPYLSTGFLYRREFTNGGKLRNTANTWGFYGEANTKSWNGLRFFGDLKWTRDFGNKDAKCVEFGITPGVEYTLPSIPLGLKLRYGFAGYHSKTDFKRFGCESWHEYRYARGDRALLDWSARRFELSAVWTLKM